MAAVAFEPPRFHGLDTEDLDIFIANYLGHLNTIGIDPTGEGGPPTGYNRAMGILRSCMLDEAARWFDLEISGKNWELSGINNVNNQTLDALTGLTIAGAGGGAVAPNTYVAGSNAGNYAGVGANAGVTFGDAFLPDKATILARHLDVDVELRRAGGQPTNRPSNITKGAPPTAQQLLAGGTLVLPGIRPEQALYWIRDQYPTIVEEKRRLRFNNLYQEYDEPVRTFYNRVVRAGRLLNLNAEMINDQFYRGLLPDNSLEAERISNVNVEGLIKILEKVERKKNELRAGRHRRDVQAERDIYRQPSDPISTPSQGITQEQVDQLLKKQAEAFQSQIQQLQASLSARPVRKPPLVKHRTIKPQIREQVKPQVKPQVRQYDYQEDDFIDDDWLDPIPEVPDDPYNRTTDEEHARLAEDLFKMIQEDEHKKRMRGVRKRLRNLSLDDEDDDAMDISNLLRAYELVPDGDGRIILTARGKKKEM